MTASKLHLNPVSKSGTFNALQSKQEQPYAVLCLQNVHTASSPSSPPVLSPAWGQVSPCKASRSPNVLSHDCRLCRQHQSYTPILSANLGHLMPCKASRNIQMLSCACRAYTQHHQCSPSDAVTCWGPPKVPARQAETVISCQVIARRTDSIITFIPSNACTCLGTAKSLQDKQKLSCAVT